MIVIIFTFLLFLLVRSQWVFNTRFDFIDRCSKDIYDNLASYPMMLFSVWNWSQNPKKWVKNSWKKG